MIRHDDPSYPERISGEARGATQPWNDPAHRNHPLLDDGSK